MKRLLIAEVALMFVVTLAVDSQRPRATGAQPVPPNVVVIVADDMRLDQLNDMPTVMSQLVGKGRSFEQAFIPDPICCPSRTSFLRGQYAHSTSVYDVDGPWGGWQQIRDAGIENKMLNTWLDPSHFTALVGKYQNGYNASALPGPTGSWDYGRVLHKPGYAAGTWTYTDGTVRRTGQEYSTTFLGRAAVNAIDASGTEPIFLWYAPYAPHNPTTPEPQYANETAECGDVDNRQAPSFNEPATDTVVVDGLSGMQDKPRWLKNRAAWADSKVRTYGYNKPRNACRTLLSVDDTIENILVALRAKDPGLGNTVIVFTSDQGVMYGEHALDAKRSPHEETIRVPHVVRADGLFGEQSSVDTENLVLNIDLAPTILDLTDVTGSPGCANEEPFRSACLARGGGFDGRSLVPLLGPTVIPTPGFADRVFLIEMSDDDTFPEYCAVRSADAKLVSYDKGNGADFEGYDLTGEYGRSDPYELHSVVYSGADGVPRFRGPTVEGKRLGEALYRDLAPQLRALCDPFPPEYSYPIPVSP